jgi:hypothetical protein
VLNQRLLSVTSVARPNRRSEFFMVSCVNAKSRVYGSVSPALRNGAKAAGDIGGLPDRRPLDADAGGPIRAACLGEVARERPLAGEHGGDGQVCEQQDHRHGGKDLVGTAEQLLG